MVQNCCHKLDNIPSTFKDEPHHEKICFFVYVKTKAQISCTIKVTVQLISAFVLATKLVQSLY